MYRTHVDWQIVTTDYRTYSVHGRNNVRRCGYQVSECGLTLRGWSRVQQVLVVDRYGNFPALYNNVKLFGHLRATFYSPCCSQEAANAHAWTPLLTMFTPWHGFNRDCTHQRWHIYDFRSSANAIFRSQFTPAWFYLRTRYLKFLDEF